MSHQDPKQLEPEFLTQQGRCPKGHVLPHKTNAGRCTPVYCAGKTVSPKNLAKGEKPVPPSGITAVGEDVDEAIERIERKLALAQAKKKHFKIPDGLTGGEAEAFIDRRLVELGVDALLVLEEQLKIGSKDEQFRAAGRVLDAIGRGKREVGGSSGPVIMLVGAKDGTIEVPWAQRVEKPKVKAGDEEK